MQCSIGLFALTPVRGTKLKAPSPPLVRYRALQCARYLISTQQSHVDEMQFMDGKLVSMPMPSDIFYKIMNTGLPFRTSGCPDCNRPNYNERPGGITYNYAKPLTHDEMTQAIDEVNEYLHL
jgi:biotin synthase